MILPARSTFILNGVPSGAPANLVRIFSMLSSDTKEDRRRKDFVKLVLDLRPDLAHVNLPRGNRGLAIESTSPGALVSFLLAKRKLLGAL